MGFWIFASVCVICLVFLYTKTKNEWNWKKIILWLVGIVVVAIAALILFISWDSIFSQAPNTQNNKGYLTSYKDIKIGSKLSDIQFRYGTLKQEKKYASDKFDLYTVNDEAGIYIGADGKVDAIVVFCNGNSDKFNGISCGDPSEKLEKKFGSDLKILCKAKDKNGWEDVEVSRAYDVAKYGTRYVLTKNKVVFIGIMQKEDFDNDQKKWGICD